MASVSLPRAELVDLSEWCLSGLCLCWDPVFEMEMPFPRPGEARSWPRSLPSPAGRRQELLLGAIEVAESGCVWLQRSLSRRSYPGGREGGHFRQLLTGWPGCWLNEECLGGRVAGGGDRGGCCGALL